MENNLLEENSGSHFLLFLVAALLMLIVNAPYIQCANGHM